METPILSIKGLTKRFGGLVAVSDVGFDVNEGDTIGLMGPNGAGKSTLLNVVAGEYKPDGGYIMGPKSAMDECNPELVKVWFDFTKEYGVYN